MRISGVPTGRPAEGDYTVTLAGDDGGTVDADDYTRFVAARGFNALDTVDLFNLLVIPPPTPTGNLPAAVWPLAATYASRAGGS